MITKYQNPLNNRLIKISTLIAIIAIAYYKKDLLNQVLQTSPADNNILEGNSQHITVQTEVLQIGSNVPFMRAVEYHTDEYNKAFVIYAQRPNYQMPASFCGAKVTIQLIQTTLDRIGYQTPTKDEIKGREITLESGGTNPKGVASEIFPELYNEIPYARKGDQIYACKNTLQRSKMTEFAPKDILCQSITIKEVYPQTTIPPLHINLIKPGSKNKTKCWEEVEIQYTITDRKGHIKNQGTIENLKVGNGSAPIQVEQALLRIGKGGKIIIVMPSNKTEFTSFSQEQTTPIPYMGEKYLIDEKVKDKRLIFNIKRTN